MTFPKFHDDMYHSYDYDYSVHHDSNSYHHVAEASRQGRVLKPRCVATCVPPLQILTRLEIVEWTYLRIRRQIW